MKKVVILALAVLSLAVTTGASAGRSQFALANPANVCRDFLSLNVGGYSSFEQCTEMLMADATAYRFFNDAGELVNPFQRCADFGFDYPVTLLEDPTWPFPVYTANNRVQCGLAIYAYHTFVGGGGA